MAPGQEPRLLESRSMVLGALPDAVGMESTIDVDLDRGDRIVLYTDGITDVFDSRAEKCWGSRAFNKLCAKLRRLPAQRNGSRPFSIGVAEWREGPTVDDVSIVLAEVL